MRFSTEQKRELHRLLMACGSVTLGRLVDDRANGLSVQESGARRGFSVDDVKGWLRDWDNAINCRIPQQRSYQLFAARAVRYGYDRKLMSAGTFDAVRRYLTELQAVNPGVKFTRAHAHSHPRKDTAA